MKTALRTLIVFKIFNFSKVIMNILSYDMFMKLLNFLQRFLSLLKNELYYHSLKFNFLLTLKSFRKSKGMARNFVFQEH